MVTKITTLLVTLMLGIIANAIYDYIKIIVTTKKVKFPFKKLKTQEQTPKAPGFLFGEKTSPKSPL